MKVHVTPLFIKGVQKQKWMRAMGNARGTLYLSDRHDNLNRRNSRVAELKDTDDPQRRQWLMFDVQLVWAKGSTFLLSGYERRIEGIDTATNYMQAWIVSFPVPGELLGITSQAMEAVAPTEQQIEELLAEAGV